MTAGGRPARIPDDLEQRIANALAQLRARTDGQLPLPLRRYVRQGLGPWTADEAGSYSPGWRRRARLARLVAERVMPLWAQDRPDDDLPQRMLQLADDVLAGRTTSEDAREEANIAAGELYADSRAAGPAGSAGFAAVNAVLAATDGDYDPEDVPADYDDDDLDPYGWEGAFHAAFAEAPYSPPEMGDVEARRRYWQWYLEQAVPAAYAAGPPP